MATGRVSLLWWHIVIIILRGGVESMIEFGATLKKIRLQKGFSQQYVADQLNLTRQTISKWENGRGYPDFENLILLSELYGVSIDKLVNRQTLNLDPVKVLKMNKKREKAMWLTKRAKVFVMAIVVVLFVLGGKSIYDDRQMRLSDAEVNRYFVSITNVKKIRYEKSKDGRLTELTAIVLKNDEVLHYPTLSELKKRKLVIPNKPTDSNLVTEPENVQTIFKSLLTKNAQRK
jgi:transcriptional regulator with XRE-family HTH domain